MSTIIIKCKRYNDVVLCDLPQTTDSEGVVMRLVIHGGSLITATGRYQFAINPYAFDAGDLQMLVNTYLNPDVVKVDEV